VKIVSGGQTGADRGGVDGAIAAGADWGGWIPKGRKAERGLVPASYDRFVEHASSGYPPRTYANVRDSDLTVIFSASPMTPGCKLTVRYCREQDKSFILLNATRTLKDPSWAAGKLKNFLARNPGAETLNVAGSRESKVPGLQAAVQKVIEEVLSVDRQS
jgi:hypothetical protein